MYSLAGEAIQDKQARAILPAGYSLSPKPLCQACHVRD
jgi:hypothetical protein